MYSFGVQYAKAVATNYDVDTPPGRYREAIRKRAAFFHKKRISNPYYRYGFEHPVGDAYAESERINWLEVLGRS